MRLRFYLLLLLITLSLDVNEAKRRKMRKSRPNIIFLLMDDLDLQLGSLEVMKKTRRIFEKNGAEFTNAFVTSPICCPSRSSILTGMYAHNHGCMTNTVNCASLSWRRGSEKRNFGHYLHESGYKTGYFGKYLNSYDGSWIPKGWDSWVGLLKNSKFYNYTLNVNNVFRRYGNNYKKDYFTHVLANYSIQFFKESKQKQPDKPVMMVLGMSAPHGPEDPAPQHKHMFQNVTAPRFPNFNVYSPTKHWLLQYTKPMDAQKIAFADHLYRRRLLTLLSVDDAIARLYKSLKANKMLQNTYIFMSSDHGYHLGQFGLAKGKSLPYETDIRVPFFALGPKVPRATKIKDIVLNIDLAPTFLDLGRTKIPGSMDGRSIVDILQSHGTKNAPTTWRDTFLIEKSKTLYGSKYMTKKKAPSLHGTKSEQIKERCNLLNYTLPCVEGQEWTCVRLDGQLRLRKCRKTAEVGRKTTRLPRSLARRRCKCPKKGKDYSRRFSKRDVERTSADYSRYKKHENDRKELKKLISYERLFKKGSKASYREKVFQKAVQHRLKKIKLRIQASRKRLASLRSLKKRFSKMVFKDTDQNCMCVNGRPYEVERVRILSKHGPHSTSATYNKKKTKRPKKKRLSKPRKAKKNRCAIKGLNCFEHTENHWKTEPLWKNGSFCFCPTSSNNTYWCIRTLNATHNYLYCEFITSFCEYFDLNADPYQLTNQINNISRAFHEDLHRRLGFLANCRHSKGCDMYPERLVPLRTNYPVERACTNRKYIT